MDDDEEIDIVGDFDDNDISKINSGQLLSCDYTVHPKWVNENAEGGNYWSDSVPKHENLEDNVEVLHSEEVVIEDPIVSNKNFLDIEWGGEISSRNDYVVFEEDIPATSEEVIEDEEIEDCEEEENCHISTSQETNSLNIYSSGNEWDESVAAFETHPAPENNKYIGPRSSRSLLKVNIQDQIQIPLNPNPRSLLKKNYSLQQNFSKKSTKFKQTLIISTNMFQKSMKRKQIELNEPKPKNTKFRQSLKIKKNQIKNLGIKENAEKFIRSKIQQENVKNKKSCEPKIRALSVSKKGRKPKKLPTACNVTTNHDLQNILQSATASESQNYHTKSLDLLSGTLVKLEKVENDEEIDIEADLSEDEIIDLKKSLFGDCSPNWVTENSLNSIKPLEHTSKKETKQVTTKRKSSVEGKKTLELTSELEFEIKKNREVPKHELILSPHEVTDIEKYFNSEYFDGRSTSKTPEQYLRIRNHILTMWNLIGKNGYVSKTSVRNGLKHGGDVNSISKIHRLLEQIGAINFGYQEKYFEYVRPLEDYFSTFQNKYSNSLLTNTTINESISGNRKPRVRTRTNNFMFHNVKDYNNFDDGNYTINHQENNLVSKTTNGNLRSEISPIYEKINQTLVECLKFPTTNLPPFKVSLTLSALLSIQLHSVSSQNVVMGFLGGHRSKLIGKNKICITQYKPYKKVEYSGTLCEICPITQVEKFSNFKQDGYEVVGWFHSHPYFNSVNPTRIDVQTQMKMQMQFAAGTDQEFIGLIMNCSNYDFNCIYILPKDYNSHFNHLIKPYQFDVDIIKDCTNFKSDIQDVIKFINQNENSDETRNIIHKFKVSCEDLLKKYSYDSKTFFEGIL